MFSRRLRTNAWLTETANNSWIDDIYAPRGLGISTNGEIIETHRVLSGLSSYWDWRVVGPHMRLTEEEIEALTALADKIATKYPYESDTTPE
ncbi:MAG: hypothetical protein WBP12_05400 [Candidatus Saccharimonas sp.]